MHCISRKTSERGAGKRPIKRFTAYLLDNGIADQVALDAIRTGVDAEIESAVQSAMAAPDPSAGRHWKGYMYESAGDCPGPS